MHGYSRMYEASNTQYTCQENVVDYCPSWQYSSYKNTVTVRMQQLKILVRVWCNVPPSLFHLLHGTMVDKNVSEFQKRLIST